MKKALILLTCFISTAEIYAQSPIVYDPFLIGVTTAGSSLQMSRLDDIKKHQTKIEEFQALAVTELNFINKWQEKIYKGLSEVSAVIKDAKNVLEAKAIVEGIFKYQKQVTAYAQEDPLLILFAEKSEVELINRSLNLILYIETVALAGGENMLMDAGERAGLINHVLEELRLIRALAYSAQRQMYWARMDGVFRALNPFQKYIDKDKQIANDILRNFKF